MAIKGLGSAAYIDDAPKNENVYARQNENWVNINNINVEILSISLTTNQNSHEDLNGINFTVIYKGNETVYTWNGSEIIIKLDSGEPCEILFDDVDGYKTPDPMTFISEAGYTRYITATYKTELLNINVTSNKGPGVMNDFEVFIAKRGVVNGVPENYTPIEYIESSGTQYIDTGYKGDHNTSIHVDFMLLSSSEYTGATSNKNNYLLYNSSSSGVKLLYGNYYTDDKINTVDFYIDKQSVSKSIPSFLDNRLSVTIKLTSEGEYPSASFNNGYTITHRTYYSPSSYTLKLFKSEYGIDGIGRIYKCKIYNNDNLIYDYQPVMDENGIPGLYDIVNNKFIRSSSGTDFYPGPPLDPIGIHINNANTWKIPYGTKYALYSFPSNIYNTSIQYNEANTNSKTLQYIYDIVPYGVYIQGISGKLYTQEEWSSQETANSVAVITDQCRFIISLEDIGSGCRWGGLYSLNNTLIEGVLATTDINVAKQDFSGKEHSKILYDVFYDDYVNNDGDSDVAIIHCKDYKFPNGQSCYLGAAGEWNVVGDNRTEIDNAMALVGESIRYFISSTQYDAQNFWSLDFGNNTLKSSAKSGSIKVRALGELR